MSALVRVSPGDPPRVLTPTLAAFDRGHAERVLSWVQGARELRHWAALEQAPGASIFERWLAEPDVHGYLLVEDAPIAYAELWVSAAEDEVEFAHVVVSPGHRNRGLGGRLVERLLEEAAGFQVAEAWMRVAPDNEPALRCYARCGFESVSAAEESALNTGQPSAYRWLRRDVPRSS